jgi:hypothetical protein
MHLTITTPLSYRAIWADIIAAAWWEAEIFSQLRLEFDYVEASSAGTGTKPGRFPYRVWRRAFLRIICRYPSFFLPLVQDAQRIQAQQESAHT